MKQEEIRPGLTLFTPETAEDRAYIERKRAEWKSPPQERDGLAQLMAEQLWREMKWHFDLQRRAESQGALLVGTDNTLTEMVRNFDLTAISEFVLLVMKNKASVQQTLRSHKAHQSNYEVRDRVYQWLDSNFESCKSMDNAAERMQGVFHKSFRTLRSHVTAWKKLRTPGQA